MSWKIRPDFRPAIRASATIAADVANIDYDNGRVTAALKHFQNRPSPSKIGCPGSEQHRRKETTCRRETSVSQAMRDLGRVDESMVTERDIL